MTPAERRITDARERLRAALIAGEDTTVLRESISRMLADAEKAEQRKAEADAEIEATRTATIGARAQEITADVIARLDADLARYDAPEETFA